MILYSHHLYSHLARWLGLFERRVPHREQAEDDGMDVQWPDAILFGLGRYGGDIAHGLCGQGWQVLGIDFDPEVVNAQSKKGLSVRYGDAEDPEFLSMLPLQHASWVISTAHERTVNLSLLAALKNYEYIGRVAVRVHSEEDAKALSRAGADVILSPFTDGAKKAVDVLTASNSTLSGV